MQSTAWNWPVTIPVPLLHYRKGDASPYPACSRQCVMNLQWPPLTRTSVPCQILGFWVSIMPTRVVREKQLAAASPALHPFDAKVSRSSLASSSSYSRG